MFAALVAIAFGIKQSGWLRTVPIVGPMLCTPVIFPTQIAELPRNSEDEFVDNGVVWLLYTDGTLGRVDTSNGNVRLFSHAVPFARLMVPGGESTLWVAFGVIGRREVKQVDMATGQVRRTVDTGHRLPNGVGAMAAAGKTIWLGGGTGIAVMDATTGEISRELLLPLPTSSPVLLVPGDRALWCAGERGEDVILYRVDESGGAPQEVGQIKSAHIVPALRGASAYGSVWIPYAARGISFFGNRLARVNPSTGAVSSETTYFESTGSRVGGNWRVVRLYSDGGQLWQVTASRADHLDMNGLPDGTMPAYSRFWISHGAVDAQGRLWLDIRHTSTNNNVLKRADPPR